VPETSPAPFSAAGLEATLAAFPGAGDDARQPPDVRFLRGVAKIVRKRLGRRTEGANPTPSVFLLMPKLPERLGVATSEHPMLDNGRTDVEGQLWFVGAPVVRGLSTQLIATTDAEIWDAVRGLGFGHVPAVLYDPRTRPPEVRYYPVGLDEADTCAVTPVTEPAAITLDIVFGVIDRLHERQLVTPDAQAATGKLWRKPDQGWPVPQAELTVQMYLETALNIGFPTCTVRREQPQMTGRLDLEIEEPEPTDPSDVIRHVILELKVLRSRNSKGGATSANETAKWVDEGVEQAHAYRVERKARLSALCCFDMRADHDDPFVAVTEKAAKLDVVLRVWRLYPTSKKFRSVLAGP
jgi:hypothetical protein